MRIASVCVCVCVSRAINFDSAPRFLLFFSETFEKCRKYTDGTASAIFSAIDNQSSLKG